MTLMTRAATAVAVLAVAAIPVGALTIKNSSTKPISIAVDNGTQEAVYQVPANGSVDVKQDCTPDCAVTGPWGFSRFVSENAVIASDGESLVTVAAQPQAQSLVPQNPVTEPSDAAASIATGALPDAKATEAEPAKPASKVRRSAKQAQKGPSSGSLDMLFSGPSKK
jgi:hypothetical protein